MLHMQAIGMRKATLKLYEFFKKKKLFVKYLTSLMPKSNDFQMLMIIQLKMTQKIQATNFNTNILNMFIFDWCVIDKEDAWKFGI